MQTLEIPHVVKIWDNRARLKDNPRVKVSMIVTDYRQGMSAERMVETYPHLSLAEVHAALAYFYDHQEEIEQELAEGAAAFEELKKNESPRSRALRERLRAHRSDFE